MEQRVECPLSGCCEFASSGAPFFRVSLPWPAETTTLGPHKSLSDRSAASGYPSFVTREVGSFGNGAKTVQSQVLEAILRLVKKDRRSTTILIAAEIAGPATSDLLQSGGYDRCHSRRLRFLWTVDDRQSYVPFCSQADRIHQAPHLALPANAQDEDQVRREEARPADRLTARLPANNHSTFLYDHQV